MTTQAAMSVEELTQLIDEIFPQTHGMSIEAAGGHHARVRQAMDDTHLRPGGTISGPSIMALADYALYIAILADLGPVALAVTTSFNCNFLNKPEANKDLIADCRLLKMGKRLAVGEVTLYSEGKEEPVAHVTGTYSIPSR